jgi:L,D-peptidoglycan transpeptidase YkuD (ErfK/YbiS/YcfS/YnhG family)
MLKISLLVAVACLAACTEADHVVVRGTGGHSCQLSFHGETFPCSLGTNGVSSKKVEGDRKTPSGSFPLREVFYRDDKVPVPKTGLNTTPLKPNFGWCDDTESPDYNKFIYLPSNYSHESLYPTIPYV